MCPKTGIWIMYLDEVEFVSNKREQHTYARTTHRTHECVNVIYAFCPAEIKKYQIKYNRMALSAPHSDESTIPQTPVHMRFFAFCFFFTFEFIIIFYSFPVGARDEKGAHTTNEKWMIREFYESAAAAGSSSTRGQSVAPKYRKQSKWRNL